VTPSEKSFDAVQDKHSRIEQSGLWTLCRRPFRIVFLLLNVDEDQVRQRSSPAGSAGDPDVRAMHSTAR